MNAEDDNRADITLESKLHDYCRWESGSRAETARVMAEWLEALEAVGADITSEDICEVNFTLTLRQAFQLAADHGWEWTPCGGLPECWLAGCLEDKEFDFHDHERFTSAHPIARRIAALWDLYDQSVETALRP